MAEEPPEKIAIAVGKYQYAGRYMGFSCMLLLFCINSFWKGGCGL